MEELNVVERCMQAYRYHTRTLGVEPNLILLGEREFAELMSGPWFREGYVTVSRDMPVKVALRGIDVMRVHALSYLEVARIV